MGLVNLMKRAAKGLVRVKFPGRTRGNARNKDRCTPKALLAILHAQALCKAHRRLPTKAEVAARSKSPVSVTGSRRASKSCGIVCLCAQV